MLLDETYIDVAQVAEKLHVSKSLVYKWVKAKRIPYYKPHEAIRFSVREIDEWLKEHHNDPTFAKETEEDE